MTVGLFQQQLLIIYFGMAVGNDPHFTIARV